LVIFDKDGTLIDFNFMWAAWVRELARRIEHETGRGLAPNLYARMGYDAETDRVRAGSPLAAHSMAALKTLTIQIIEQAGLPKRAAGSAAARAWFVPDAVALSRPLGDVQGVFSTLRRHGIRVAVATSDDRAPTEATLQAMGVAELVDALVCADDGLANKPAPDMIHSLCRTLKVAPSDAIVVGDSVADMLAGRAARVGLCVGVLSGVTPQAELQPYADRILRTLEELIR
jgi:phosphoglycolate phosphatase